MSEELHWISGEFQEGYSVIFCESLGAGELLTRLGSAGGRSPLLTQAEADLIEAHYEYPEMVDLEDVDGLDLELLEENGFLGERKKAVLRVGSVGKWSFVIQGSATLVNSRNCMAGISRGCRAFSVSSDINSTMHVEFALNGLVVSSFDPLFPPGHSVGQEFAIPGLLLERNESHADVLRYLEEYFDVGLPRSVVSARLPSVAVDLPS